MKLRIWVARGLWIGAASLIISIVAGLLSFVLRTMGDIAGAEAVRGICIVATSASVLALVELVTVLSLIELSRGDGPNSNEAAKPNEAG